MKQFITTYIILLAFSAQAQIKFEGHVKDSLNNPLDLANIIAIDQETNKLHTFSITDEKGYFILSLEKQRTYKVQVSYIGKKTYENIVTTETSNIKKEIILEYDNALETVELSYKMPVSIKGDTLIYNADSFKNGSERKLEDVLEKLPGVEINEEGQVEVEGKVVNKLMVNGKDFFDGDTKIATKNIPSNAVDKIEVLRNYSEVNQLRSVSNNQDNVALNIKLKTGRESFWFGNITFGGGSSKEESLYLLQPKLFFYSPKFSLNFIGDINNSGQVALTSRDLRGFSGGFGFRAPSRSSGTNINLGNNNLNFLTNQDNALEINYKLGAASFSYSPSKNLDLSGYAILNVNEIASRQRSYTQYTDADLGIPDESSEQWSQEKSDQGLLKLSLSYKPNYKNQLDYDVLGRTSKDVQDQNSISSVLGGSNQYDKSTPFSINQTLKYYYTLDDNNIFAFEALHQLKNEDPFYEALLQNDPLNNSDPNPNNRDSYDTTAEALGLDTSLNNYNLGQNKKINSNQLDAKLDFYHILNSVSNINITLGTILSRQEFNSNIFQFLENDEIFNPTPTFDQKKAENDTEYNFSDLYLGFHYRLKTGKFTITPGFSLHQYTTKNIQYGDIYKDNFFRVLPDFETRIQLKKSESLTFRYDMRNQFTDVTRLAKGLVLNSINSIQYGEPELQNALSHNFSLLYSSFNLFNYTNVFGRLAYSKNIDQIRSLTDFENVISTSTFFNSNFADETVSAFGRIQRTFGKIRATLNTRFNYSKLNQFIFDRQSVNEGFTQSYTPGLRTNFKIAPNFSLRYQYTVFTNKQGTVKTVYYTNAPSFEVDAYILKSFTVKSDYTYVKQKRDNGNEESFQNWNASIAYKKDRDAKWEFELSGTNLLNINSRINNRATNLSVSTFETFVQPRFVTLRMRYIL
jgi:hypothetical protein